MTKAAQESTHHFKVTWPFWTRFMLKPTVGMELWPLALGPTVMMELMVGQSCAVGMLLLAQRGANIDALNSELSSLDSMSSVGQGRRDIVDAARPLPDLEDTHRQNSQQRSLASVLQADHGDVHLCGPTERK